MTEIVFLDYWLGSIIIKVMLFWINYILFLPLWASFRTLTCFFLSVFSAGYQSTQLGVRWIGFWKIRSVETRVVTPVPWLTRFYLQTRVPLFLHGQSSGLFCRYLFIEQDSGSKLKAVSRALIVFRCVSLIVSAALCYIYCKLSSTVSYSMYSDILHSDVTLLWCL